MTVFILSNLIKENIFLILAGLENMITNVVLIGTLIALLYYIIAMYRYHESVKSKKQVTIAKHQYTTTQLSIQPWK